MVDRDMSTAKPSGPREFNFAVHGLRGLAAMMVFLAHILNGLREHAYGDRPHFVDSSEAFWNLGTYGVYLFFTISGFVILPSVMRYSIKEFSWGETAREPTGFDGLGRATVRSQV